jgi:hypothetical protein
MDRSRTVNDSNRLYNKDWVESLQSIVDRTENNLKGISAKDDPILHSYTPKIPCCDDNFSPNRIDLENKNLLS